MARGFALTAAEITATVAAVARAADHGGPCPSDAEFGRQLGVDGEAAKGRLRHAERAGLIHRELQDRRRRLRIVATGACTGWGAPNASTHGKGGDWTEERLELLRTLWDEGLLAAEIGRRLGVSKSAVIGKSNRLNLAPRPSPILRDVAPRPAARPAPRPRTMPSYPRAEAPATTVSIVRMLVAKVAPAVCPASVAAAPVAAAVKVAPVSLVEVAPVEVAPVEVVTPPAASVTQAAPVPIAPVRAHSFDRPVRHRTCQWIREDGRPPVFCDAPCERTYCGTHHALAYVARVPRTLRVETDAPRRRVAERREGEGRFA